MTDNSTSASSQTNPPKAVWLWGHTKVVFTWPMVFMGIILVALHALGLPENLALWFFAGATCLVITTLAIDIKMSSFIICVTIIILILVIMVFVAHLWFDPFAMIGTFLKTIGPLGLVVLWLFLLWGVDLINSFLWERYRFERGSIWRVRVIGGDKEDLLEQCRGEKPISDALEYWTWGGDIIITNTENGEVIAHIRNVFVYEEQYKKIRPHLPRDRSDRNGG